MVAEKTSCLGTGRIGVARSHGRADALVRVFSHSRVLADRRVEIQRLAVDDA